MKTSILRAIAALAVFYLAGCETTAPHSFAQPSRDWQVRSGQLRYAAPSSTIIGDVVVRFSKNGDFELTFSKGPGVEILSLRQDATFAEVKGAMAQAGWSGPVDQAPPQLRGWLQLRDKILHSKDRHMIRHVAGAETFLLRF